MKRFIYTLPRIESVFFCSTYDRSDIIASIQSESEPILASISSKDITRSMIRVKSSNVWSYAINVKSKKDPVGDVYVQFKGNHGGPGDVYVYYNVPVRTWRKILSTPSKGHAVWQFLRNNPAGYSKLTGDKRGKLRNAINH